MPKQFLACPVSGCDYSCRDRKADVVRHINDKHESAAAGIKCTDCDHRSKQPAHFKTHWRAAHAGPQGKIFAALCGSDSWADTTQATRHFSKCSDCQGLRAANPDSKKFVQSMDGVAYPPVPASTAAPTLQPVPCNAAHQHGVRTGHAITHARSQRQPAGQQSQPEADNILEAPTMSFLGQEPAADFSTPSDGFGAQMQQAFIDYTMGAVDNFPGPQQPANFGAFEQFPLEYAQPAPIYDTMGAFDTFLGQQQPADFSAVEQPLLDQTQPAPTDSAMGAIDNNFAELNSWNFPVDTQQDPAANTMAEADNLIGDFTFSDAMSVDAEPANQGQADSAAATMGSDGENSGTYQSANAMTIDPQLLLSGESSTAPATMGANDNIAGTSQSADATSAAPMGWEPAQQDMFGCRMGDPGMDQDAVADAAFEELFRPFAQ